MFERFLDPPHRNLNFGSFLDRLNRLEATVQALVEALTAAHEPTCSCGICARMREIR